MCEDISYGPERKPWAETLSNWGRDGGKLLVSPPSKDPLELHDFPKEEKGITSTLYQVTTRGFSKDHYNKAQTESAEYMKVKTENFLGFQATLRNDYGVVSAYLNGMCNNAGDPFKPSLAGSNMKWMERNVLDYYASLWNAKWPHDDTDLDSYWGYILTMGSSEGNIFGLWKARDYLQGKFIFTQEKDSCTDSRKKMPKFVTVQAELPSKNLNAYTPIVFYSEDTHTSVSKALEMLELKTFYDVGSDQYPKDCPLGAEWPCEVPSSNGVSGPGSIDVDALYKLAEFFIHKGHPIIIVLNYGTTFKGGYDDVKEVGERLMPLLRNNKMDQRCCEVVNPFISKAIQGYRNGFWIHVDGALGASYMPFHQMAFIKGRTDVTPGPIFDFRLPFVCSISTSGHKFPGSPIPTGIFMTKTGLLISSDLPTVGYLGCPDTTLSVSRSAIAAVIWWTYISSHDYDRQVNKILHCLNLVKTTTEKLKRLESKLGKDLWIAQAPASLAVRFKKPNDTIAFKYSLPSETIHYKEEMRTYTHIYLMGGTTEAKVDELMEELEVPNAFDCTQLAN